MHPSLTPEAPTRARFRESRHLTRLGLFGSRLDSTVRADSDIDLRVEFEPPHAPGSIRLSGIEAERFEWLGAQRVELRMADALSDRFRNELLANAQAQHARR